MKVHFLPAVQQKMNDTAMEKVRRTGYGLFALLILDVMLGAVLYLRPPRSQRPQAFTEDGRTLEAIVLAPDLVLTPNKVSGSAEFVAPGERKNAQRINSTALPDGTELTLFRLESSTASTPAVVVVIEPGDSLAAHVSGQEWHGKAVEKVANGYSLEPDFSLPPGTPVFRESDMTALAGFGVKLGSSSVVIPAKDVLVHFPELGGGH